MTFARRPIGGAVPREDEVHPVHLVVADDRLVEAEDTKHAAQVEDEGGVQRLLSR